MVVLSYIKSPAAVGDESTCLPSTFYQSCSACGGLTRSEDLKHYLRGHFYCPACRSGLCPRCGKGAECQEGKEGKDKVTESQETRRWTWGRLCHGCLEDLGLSILVGLVEDRCVLRLEMTGHSEELYGEALLCVAMSIAYHEGAPELVAIVLEEIDGSYVGGHYLQGSPMGGGYLNGDTHWLFFDDVTSIESYGGFEELGLRDNLRAKEWFGTWQAEEAPRAAKALEARRLAAKKEARRKSRARRVGRRIAARIWGQFWASRFRARRRRLRFSVRHLERTSGGEQG